MLIATADKINSAIARNGFQDLFIIHPPSLGFYRPFMLGGAEFFGMYRRSMTGQRKVSNGEQGTYAVFFSRSIPQTLWET
jgi:hypothetical protein